MFICYFPALCCILVLINLTTVFVNYTVYMLWALPAQELIHMGYLCLLNVYFFANAYLKNIFKYICSTLFNY